MSDHTFGMCYPCRDGRHRDCLGVPCECECDVTQYRAVADAAQAVVATFSLDSGWGKFDETAPPSVVALAKALQGEVFPTR